MDRQRLPHFSANGIAAGSLYLAEELDFTSGAITALSDKLEAGGYTVRKRKEGDRRTVMLDITDKGREMVELNIGSRIDVQPVANPATQISKGTRVGISEQNVFSCLLLPN